jgi:hypothetical protein
MQADAYFALHDRTDEIYASRAWVEDVGMGRGGLANGSDTCGCGKPKDKRAKKCHDCVAEERRQQLAKSSRGSTAYFDGDKLLAELRKQRRSVNDTSIALGLSRDALRGAIYRGRCSKRVLCDLCMILNVNQSELEATHAHV